jgi:hypothetical protein
MTLDLKLAAAYYASAAAILALILLLAMMRLIINHTFAASGHAFYVISKGVEPRCATCPFRKRCPYSNGQSCMFSQ